MSDNNKPTETAVDPLAQVFDDEAAQAEQEESARLAKPEHRTARELNTAALYGRCVGRSIARRAVDNKVRDRLRQRAASFRKSHR